MNTGEFKSEYSDIRIAQSIYDEVVDDPDNKIVDTFYPDSHPVYLYEIRDGNDIVIYFVPKNDKFIYGYASYEETPDGGAMMVGVYNMPMYHGLAQAVYNRFIIPKYRYIMSSGRHSPMGQSFWKKIVLSNLNTSKVEIWDVNTNSPIQKIKNIPELKLFYGDDVDYERYRIKISKI